MRTEAIKRLHEVEIVTINMYIGLNPVLVLIKIHSLDYVQVLVPDN